MLHTFSSAQQYTCSLPARNIFHEPILRIYPDPYADQRNLLYIFGLKKEAMEFYSKNIVNSSVETHRRFFFFQNAEPQEDCFALIGRWRSRYISLLYVRNSL